MELDLELNGIIDPGKKYLKIVRNFLPILGFNYFFIIKNFSEREGVWESTYQYSNCVSFQDGNTAVTSTQSSSPPIVVRGSPCLRRKGQFLFELHIKNKTGDIGIGIVNKYFDFNTNRFSNSLKGKSWVYWSSGFIRDVAGLQFSQIYFF